MSTVSSGQGLFSKWPRSSPRQLQACLIGSSPLIYMAPGRRLLIHVPDPARAPTGLRRNKKGHEYIIACRHGSRTFASN
jgi:hypothetical protein